MAVMTRLALLAASALAFASSVSAQAEDADGFVIAIAPPGYCKLFNPACAAVCTESYPTKKPVKSTCQPAKHKKGGYRTRCMCGNVNATKLARGRAAHGSKGTPSVGPAQTITSTSTITSTVTPTTISTVTEPIILQLVATAVTTSYAATTFVPGTDVPYALRKRTEGALEARAAKTTNKPTAKQTQTAKKTANQTAKKTTKITKSVKPTTSVPKVPASVAPGGTVTLTTVVTATATAPTITSMTTTSVTVQTIYTSTTTSTSAAPLQTITSPNLVTNYDFETVDSGGAFADWIPGGQGGTLVPDTTQHHGGSQSAYLPASRFLRYLYQSVPVTQGQTYRYGCWFKGDGNNYFAALSRGDTRYGSVPTNSWGVVSTTFTWTAASGTSYFGGGVDTGNTFEGWMDSCFFYRIA